MTYWMRTYYENRTARKVYEIVLYLCLENKTLFWLFLRPVGYPGLPEKCSWPRCLYQAGSNHEMGVRVEQTQVMYSLWDTTVGQGG